MTLHVRFQDTFKLRVMEWLFSLMMLAWGLVLLVVDEVFQRVAFEPLTRTAPQGTWSTWCLLLSLASLLALGVNGLWRATPHVRAMTAALRALFWLQIWMGLAASGSGETGVVAYFGLMLGELYNAFAASIDARKADDQARTNAA